jgi:hypothetical protein
MKKKLTYVLMVSKFFPSYHPKKGILTFFKNMINSGEKKHTIRGNYALWKKREEKINRGDAVLSLREWQGKPRRSKQVEIMSLDHINVQSVQISEKGEIIIDGTYHLLMKLEDLAKNDGLSRADFEEWFKVSIYALNAIIHFTKNKY